MAKNSTRSSKRTRGTSLPESAARLAPDWPMLTVALLGVMLTATLVWSASTAATLPYCAAGSGCDIVQSSSWSRFLGVPLAIWGLAAYTTLGLVAVAGRRAFQRARWTALLATAGFAISIYLTVISVVAIKATCVYCLASLALMTAAFSLSFRPFAAKKTGWRVAGFVIAAVAAGLMQVDARGLIDPARGPVDPYLRDLAQHLDKRGIRFYGAYWCLHCLQQKELFGAAARYLPYVECAPHGPKGPRATTCEMQDIKAYPTWVVEGRRIERVMTVPALATLSGFLPPAPAAPPP